ncbi:hypothetical protein ABK040_001540 [Willaertia magna]
MNSTMMDMEIEQVISSRKLDDHEYETLLKPLGLSFHDAVGYNMNTNILSTIVLERDITGKIPRYLLIPLYSFDKTLFGYYTITSDHSNATNTVLTGNINTTYREKETVFYNEFIGGWSKWDYVFFC